LGQKTHNLFKKGWAKKHTTFLKKVGPKKTQPFLKRLGQKTHNLFKKGWAKKNSTFFKKVGPKNTLIFLNVRYVIFGLNLFLKGLLFWSKPFLKRFLKRFVVLV